MHPFRQLIETLVEQELEEVNSIGAGGVSATGGSPLGQKMSPVHKAMWSGDKPLKKRRVQEKTIVRGHNTSVDLEQIHDVPEQGVSDKPNGFWYDCDGSWLRWVQSEMPSYMGDKNYTVDVDLSQMLVIRTIEELVEFSAKYGVPGLLGLPQERIDWARVAQEYGGIEICPYFSKARRRVLWYTSWDVASGCIWRASAVKKVELVKENLADKMGLKKATSQVRRNVVGGSPVYMDKHDGDEAGTKKVMKKVAKNLNRKPYSKKPPMMGLTETRFAITPEQAKHYQTMKDLGIFDNDPNFALSLRFVSNEKALQLDPGNRGKSYGVIYPNKKTLLMVADVEDWRMSPIYAEIVATLNQNIPETSDFQLLAYNSEGDTVPVGYTVGQAAKLVRQVDVRAQEFDPRGEEVTFQDFKIHVLDDLQDVTWFHATTAKNVLNIKAKGLLPSREFEQGGGWTQLNFNLQNAVYLTASEAYAEQIAETLVARFGEPAVVLRVDGAALMDKSKVVLDEDALVGDYDGMLDYGKINSDMPHYYTSVVKRIKSVGYAGVIPTSFISVETEIHPEHEESDMDGLHDEENSLTSRYA